MVAVARAQKGHWKSLKMTIVTGASAGPLVGASPSGTSNTNSSAGATTAAAGGAGAGAGGDREARRHRFTVPADSAAATAARTTPLRIDTWCRAIVKSGRRLWFRTASSASLATGTE